MLGGGRRKPVKIVVIGDEKVGKTSLVVAATNESFPDACPPVVPPAILPAECTPEGVPLQITDTSSRPEERTILEQTCLSADVVVLLFDTARPQSLKRIGSYWMPELRRIGVHLPIILVGTKSDISKQQDISALAKPVQKKFREIETCLECSAKRLVNIAEVFYWALKTVIYPVAPVFDPHGDAGSGSLKPLCVRALKRVFLINDQDKDGALSDAELNAFQVNCFSAPLQPEELIGIRNVVSTEMPQGVNAAGLTLPGFLFLHALFIERGRLETVWAVLRRYGYDDNLLLNQEVLSEVNFTRGPDQVVEMTAACRTFLSQKFAEFDKDGDKLLSVAEQSEMFSAAPTGPWRGEEFRGLVVETGGSEGSSSRSLTLTGFLAKWAFLTANDPVRALAYVRYLGFEGPAAPLFAISKTRKQERKSEQLQRSLLQVFVFLSNGSGKGLLTGGLVGQAVPQKSASQAAGTSSQSSAAGEVVSAGESSGSACTVVLHELDSGAIESLEKDEDALAAADAAAFLFNSTNLASLQSAQTALLRAAHASSDSLPCFLVAVEERGGMTEEVMTACGSLCAELELRQPLAINPASPQDVPAVLQTFLQAAANPEKALAIPQTPSLKALKQYHRRLKLAILYGTGGLAGGLLCYAVYRAFSTRQGTVKELRLSASETPKLDAPQIQRSSQ